MAVFLVFICLASAVKAALQEINNDSVALPTEHHEISGGPVVAGSLFDGFINRPLTEFDPSDPLKIFGLFISWNVISQQLSRIARLVSPTYINHRRLSESLWRLVYHIVVGLFTGNLILTRNAEILLHPFAAWTDEIEDEKVTPDEFTFLHAVEISFYLYVLSDLLRSKDKLRYGCLNSIQTILIVVLTELVYYFHYYKVGLLLFLLHDATGFVLELTKGMIYLENVSSFYKYAAYCNFGTYVGLWLYISSYWFPKKMIFCAASLSMLEKDQPVIELIVVATVLMEIVNVYWCLILVTWTKQVFYSNPYAQRSMLYRFLHKGSAKHLKKNCEQSSKESIPARRTVLQSRDAKALIQTVRCVMVMKRKLKRIREQKILQERAQMPVTDSAASNDDLIITTSDIWCNASAEQLSVASKGSNNTEGSMATAELAHLLADQVTEEAAREEATESLDHSSAADNLLNSDSFERLTTATDLLESECGSLCESDDSMRVLYDADSRSANCAPCVVGDNSSLYVDPSGEMIAVDSSKDICESMQKSATCEKGDVQL